jgi:raffinose/stachyose/melibiose transport system permease protein
MTTEEPPTIVTPDERRSEAPAPIDHRARRRNRSRTTFWSYVVLIPALVLLAVFAYYPAVNAIVFSFFTWRPGFTSTFIGLDNYIRMLGDHVWWESFANLGFVLVFGVVTWVIPFIAAELLISLSRERARFVFRTLLIAPIAFPQIVTLLLWGFMYDPSNGVLNSLLRSIGLGDLTQNWLGDPATALLALVFIGFPWVAGLPFLIFLTALQNIPSEVFDAAALDGVGRLRRIIHIDLPMMANQLVLLAFLAVISTLQYGMAAFILTGGGPDNATQFPILRMLASAFQGRDWGYAAALSTTLFCITLALGVFLLGSNLMRRNARVRVRD